MIRRKARKDRIRSRMAKGKANMAKIVKDLLEEHYKGIDVEPEPFQCANRCPLKFNTTTAANDFAKAARDDPIPFYETDANETFDIKASHDRSPAERKMAKWLSLCYEHTAAVCKEAQPPGVFIPKVQNRQRTFSVVYKPSPTANERVIDVFRLQDRAGTCVFEDISHDFLPEWLAGKTEGIQEKVLAAIKTFNDTKRRRT